MNYKMMGRFIARTLFVEALFMIPALLISAFSSELAAVQGFIGTVVLMAVLMGVLSLLCKGAPDALSAKEGLVCVGISWIVMSMLGCLPFVLSGAIPKYIDAFFEIVSGFTTTGASILARPEDLPKGILYWRSFSHWLGGMGVLVFLLALSPGDSKGGGFTMHLLRAESPGPNVGKLVPRMRKTATILYIIYIALTVLNVVFLLAGDMSLLEAVCTAFGTAGTGGLGIKSDSMAGYSPYTQYVTAVFMLLFGVNFSCYYLILLRQFKSVFKDEELRLYFGIVAGSVVMIAMDLWGIYESGEETFRHAFFQVSSIITTTGFATTDFDMWPSFSKMILLALMIIGACAGSTGGGIKVARVLLIFKSLRRNIRQVLHPRKVQVIRSNGQTVDEQIVTNTNAYLAAYVIIIIVSVLLVSLDNFSTTTNITAVLACFNNIGPGLEAVGPTCNFTGFSAFSKLVLIMDMLAGRLEIFPILALFTRSTWRHP